MKLEIEIPENTAASLEAAPETLPAEFRIAAAVKWDAFRKGEPQKSQASVARSLSIFCQSFLSPPFRNPSLN